MGRMLSTDERARVEIHLPAPVKRRLLRLTLTKGQDLSKLALLALLKTYPELAETPAPKPAGKI